MIFNEFKQNNYIINRLQKNISSGKIFHAYIFEGPNEVDKLRFALGFAEEIFCKGLPQEQTAVYEKILKEGNHPDLTVISGLDKNIKDEDIGAIQGKLNTSPVSTSHKIIIIDGADRITPKAQNRMLKVLEEPKINCVIIFLTSNSENLLPTIRSRCVILSLNPEFAELSENSAQLLNIARGLIISLKNKEPFYRITKNYESYFKSTKDVEILLQEMANLLSKDLLTAALNGETKSLSMAIDIIYQTIQYLKTSDKGQSAMKNLLIQLEDIL